MNFKIENIQDLSYSREMMEMKPKKIVSIFIYILILLIITFLCWAWFTDKEITTTVTGIVNIKENTYTISNKLPGIVKEVYLKDGQSVNAGDLLYTLDDTQLQNKKSELEKQNAELNQKLTDLDRLEKSVQNNINYFSCADNEKEYYYKYEAYAANNYVPLQEKNELLKSKDILSNKIKDLKTLEKSIDDNKNYTEKDSIYSIQFNNYVISNEALEKQIAQLQKDKQLLQTEDESKEELIKIDSEIENLKLQQKKNKNTIKSEVKTSIEELTNELNTTNNTLSSYDEKIMLSKESNKLTLLSDIESQKNTVNKELEELNSNLSDINKNIEYCSIKAENTGILDLKSSMQPGTIIEAGTPITDILPIDNSFSISLIISEKDISFLKIGQEIKYSFSSFPYNQYGFLTGTIETLSATSKVNSETASVYYTGEGTLDGKTLYRNNGESNEIKSGMTCQAKIVTRKTKMLYYLLEKLNFKKA